MLDVGTAKRIRDGRIQIMPSLATILRAGVIFEGGKERPFDAIIFATGYRPNFQNFLTSTIALAIHREASILPCILWDLKNAVTGLWEISKEAQAVARDIGHRLALRRQS